VDVFLGVLQLLDATSIGSSSSHGRIRPTRSTLLERSSSLDCSHARGSQCGSLTIQQYDVTLKLTSKPWWESAKTETDAQRWHRFQEYTPAELKSRKVVKRDIQNRFANEYGSEKMCDNCHLVEDADRKLFRCGWCKKGQLLL
jgi:hypothetical protein